jgi:hypothetical protein
MIRAAVLRESVSCRRASGRVGVAGDNSLKKSEEA